MNIWQKLKKEKIEGAFTGPILVLAPMADVTDIAFRTVIAKYGKPDVMWTEFVSADGLVMAPHDNPDEKGVTSQDKLRANLIFDPSERPIVAQIFGSQTKNIKKVSKLLMQMGFDGIDLNMGCPDRSVEKQGAGAAMIKTPQNAVKVIVAAKEGVGFKKTRWRGCYVFFRFLKLNFMANFFLPLLTTNIPISVKTRLGYNQNKVAEWLGVLLTAAPDVITIHARTRKQMSKATADWSQIKNAVEIRDSFYNENIFYKKVPSLERTLIFGNGDVKSKAEALEKAKETGCDGIMIGRGIFGNPWFFSDLKPEDISVKNRLNVMLEQTKIFEKRLPHKNFSIMKKHYKAYVEGFDGAKDLRLKLMSANNSKEVEEIINKFLLILD